MYILCKQTGLRSPASLKAQGIKQEPFPHSSKPLSDKSALNMISLTFFLSRTYPAIARGAFMWSFTFSLVFFFFFSIQTILRKNPP